MPAFELTAPALRELGGPAVVGPCGGCHAACEAAFVGQSVEMIRFALDCRGKYRGRPVVDLALWCLCCGRRSEPRLAPPGRPEVAWLTFVHGLQMLSIPPGLVPARAAVGSSTSRSVVLPSRRDPGMPSITADEAIDAVLAVRRARTDEELLRILGVPTER